MPISESLLPEYDNEMANTRKMLECVPDEKLEFQPHAKSMTLAQLASHVTEIPSWAKYTLDTESLDMKDEQPYVAKSRQEMLEAFDRYVAESRERLASATDEELAVTWTFSFEGQEIFSLPRVAVLRGFVLNHLIHHRGQLSVYLRLNDVKIPGMYGPSADEMPAMQAQSA